MKFDMRGFLLTIHLLAAYSSACWAADLPQEGDRWYREGQAQIQRLRAQKTLDRKARGVILFVGDGMSVATLTAARILEGQNRGESGEENALSFEKFPYLSLAKTYNVDSQTPDSAGTATAMLSGVKTRVGVIGVNQQVPKSDCSAQSGNEVTSLLEMAEQSGLATGIVTTTRLTHATPAAAYAHAASRNWEVDSQLSVAAREQDCRDIARQLVEFAHGDGIDVAFGGGRNFFFGATQADPETGVAGRRVDGVDLIQHWLKRYPGGTYVWNREQFNAIDTTGTGPVLGLFEPSHMQYELDRPNDQAGEPSLAEMVTKAVTLLQRNSKGFFLLAEGGRIDHAHHRGNARRALLDTIAFADAVSAAEELTSASEVLIIVTADHAHTMTFAGYPDRGNPILGLVARDGVPTLAIDDKPYTTLGYANGPGATLGERPHLTVEQIGDDDFLQQAEVPLNSETHGGDDVVIYAQGPRAFLFGGLVEQNYIFHVMREALEL